MTGADFDQSAATDYLHRLFDGAPGLLQIDYVDKHGTFRGAGGTVSSIEAAVQRAAGLHKRGARGIYVRMSTLSEAPGAGKRGGVDLSLALPALWADLDYGDVGHRPPAGALPHPPDEASARRIVEKSGLPAPSMWVHSGGGLYPLWVLETPLRLESAEVRARAVDLSRRWQEALASAAAALGWHYGAGVGDLARVLRLPGSVNRKTDTERPCVLLGDSGVRFTLEDLSTALEDVELLGIPGAPTPAPGAEVGGDDLDVEDFDAFEAFEPDSPFALLDEHVSFDEILTGAGWTRCAGRHTSEVEECWTRPGGGSTSPHSAHTLSAAPHVLVCHSENAGLPAGGGQALTRGRVFAHLHHGGDLTAAARDLRAGLRGGGSEAARALPLPRLDDDRADEAAEVDADMARRIEEERRRLLAQREARRLLAAEEAAASTLLTDLLDVRDLARLPHPEPLIPGVLNRHTYAVMRGRDGSFKTFLALDWALCVATGTDWLGRTVERARVLYIAGEGAYGLDARVKAWEAHHGVSVPSGALTILPRAVDLFAGGELDVLLAEIERGGYGLVIVDTLRRMSGRADGNGSDMGVVIDALDRIKRATDHGSVLVIAHTGKSDQDTRGFSGIEDDADTVWHVKREDLEPDFAPPVITATLAKMKDGPDGTEVFLRPQEIEAANGTPVLVEGAPVVRVIEKYSANESAILGALAANPGTGMTAKAVSVSTGIPVSTVYDAVKRLTERGTIVRTKGILRLSSRVSGGSS